MKTAAPHAADEPGGSHLDHEIDHEMDRAARARLRMGWGQRFVVALLLTVVLVPPTGGFYGYFTGKPLHLLAATKDDKDSADASVPPSYALVSGSPHTVELTEEVTTSLGIHRGDKDAIAVAQPPTQMRPLVLPGSTAFDPSRLFRVRARFAPCHVVQIAQVAVRDRKNGQTQFRELRQGDQVSEGDLLGVFYSVDVGSKKNDLLQALVQLELDQDILDKYEENQYAVPRVTYLTQRRALQGDRTEINRALSNLKVWDIPQDEIDALHTEAKKIHADKDAWFQTPEGRWVKGENLSKDGKHDPTRQKREDPWGRVTLRAPCGGVIVEKNLHVDELVVDNTVNLFQIADVSRLLVKVHCPEDELPILEALRDDQMRWTVRTVGTTSSTGLSGTIDEIGYIIDPNQHTAIIKGYVDNPGHRIRAGQFVTATVDIPPPDDVVEIPVDALVEDGKQSLVFVQPDAVKRQFTMRRVHVTHRFDRTVFVRKTPIPKDEQLTEAEKEEGLLAQEPVRPGERVLTAGSVELKRVVIDLESRPKEKPTAADRVAKAKTGSASKPESRSEPAPKAGKS
jgi:cobalt-zinc-cadmium efflux system membrane fusion protein